MRSVCLLLFVSGLFVSACVGQEPGEEASDGDPTADVTAVEVRGDSADYTVEVTVRSDDTGCEQYADWWEVVSPDGDLIARRVLAHSHVDEQPFTRSTGPVEIAPDSTVIVRAHMNDAGYGGRARTGSVVAGFREADLPDGFAAGLANEPPQPDDCAF